MRIVIDSNRIVAALLKDSTTRSILFNNKFDFIAPAFAKEEVEKHRNEFIKRVGMIPQDFKILVSLIFESVALIHKEDYDPVMMGLKSEISDPQDVPYLACCIATHAVGIWSHDPHLKEQARVRIFTNQDMLRLIHS